MKKRVKISLLQQARFRLICSENILAKQGSLGTIQKVHLLGVG